jgi:hypothetical protein
MAGIPPDTRPLGFYSIMYMHILVMDRMLCIRLVVGTYHIIGHGILFQFHKSQFLGLNKEFDPYICMATEGPGGGGGATPP